jgi:acyl-CoA synthetase (NDP forming)
LTVSGIASPSDVRLLEPDATTGLLERHGIAHLPQALAGDPDEAAREAHALGFPVALKAHGPTVVHKTELGAVELGLDTPDAVRAAAARMDAAIPGIAGFLVQPMAEAGVELIVGVRRDATFGPVVVVGLGGVLVDLLRDSSIRLAPVDAGEARAMLAELRGGELLRGYRGRAPVDVDAVAGLVAAVSRLAAGEPGVVELDLNPVIAGPGGAVPVDVRVLWSDTPRRDISAAWSPATPETVRRLMEPRSIVVIGASRDTRKQGGRLLHYLRELGYSGRLSVVHPTAGEVQGVPSFPSVAEVPDVPDLACIVVPAAAVPDAVRSCAERGIPSAIVYTAGFAETGAAGAGLHDELRSAAAAGGIRVCGPNTAGVVNPSARTFASIARAFENGALPGEIGYLTQSGALGSSLISRTRDEGVGFSKWICVGNEVDLTLGDYLDYLVDDPGTKVVMVFMEALREVAPFAAACQRAHAARKPVVVLKTGRSSAGRRAAQSHTAAIAGDARVYDAALDALGVLRVDELQTFMDVGLTLAWQPLPQGSRVGVVSASGGACSLLADACEAAGLDLPRLSPQVRARVADAIPPFGAPDNPVDVTIEVNSQPDMLGSVSRILLDSAEIDALIVLLTTNADPAATHVAEGVIAAVAGTTKPVIVTRVGGDSLAPGALASYREARIPVFPMPERAVRALAAARSYAESRWTFS